LHARSGRRVVAIANRPLDLAASSPGWQYREMDFDAPTDRLGGRHPALESAAAFAVSLAFLLALSPDGPFTKELGVCESGAVRDVLSGILILPHYARGTPVQVPPMYWWAAAIAVRLVGWNEIGLRAPSILATAITSAILYLWLASSLSRRAAIWSVPVLLSAQYIADAARQPRMDAILMMFLTAAMVCLERAISQNPKRKLLLAIAAFAMGGAILTKGPLGVILPGLTLSIFLGVERRFSELFHFDVIATFVVAVAIGGIWYLAALRVGGSAFFQFQIVHGLFRRFLGAAAGTVGECQNPFYYFIPRLVSGFLPWSLFYPALVMMLWTGRSKTPTPVSFAVCWFAAILGFFTISAGKCMVYILPLFPALAALTGWMIASAIEHPRGADLWRRFFDWATIAVAVGVVVIIVAVAALLFPGSAAALAPHLHRSDKRFLQLLMTATAQGSPGVVLWLSFWVLAAAVAFGSFARGRDFAQSAAVALIAIAGTLFWYGFMNPALASEETLQPFASVVDRTVPPGVPIDYLGQPDCDLAFYSNHEIASLKDFQCAKEPSDAFFLVWQDRLGRLAPGQRACLEPLAQSSPIDSHGARVLMIEKK
jgi:4-amino-4-deoxy-L-arabinose transferase-like glycosyltransferase